MENVFTRNREERPECYSLCWVASVVSQRSSRKWEIIPQAAGTTHSHRKAEVQAYLPVLLSLDNSSGIKRQEQEKNI